MKKFRMAIGSNDGKNIVRTHMGEAEYFYTYDLFEDGKSNFVEKIENTSPEEESKHGITKKRKAVIEILKDSDLIVGKKMSPNFKTIAAKTRFQPVIIEHIDEIPEIIKKVHESFDYIFNIVEQRRNNSRPEEIPVLG